MTHNKTNEGYKVMSRAEFGGTTNNVVRQAFVATGFESIQTNLDVAGWTGSVRQLQGGELHVAVKSASHQQLSAIDLSISRTIEISATSAPDKISVFATAGPIPCWLNARSIDSGRIVIVPPGFEVMSLFRSGSRVVFAQIPVSSNAESLSKAVGCSVSRRELANFVGSVKAFVDTPRDSNSRHESAIRMLNNIRELGHRRPVNTELEERMESRNRIIRGASDYIGEHIDESIRVRDLSEELTTSVSCLERTFRYELQMTPSQYILARRLVAAHKQLKGTVHGRKADGTVARIAMDHGFNHLGRFSGSYRRHFGELPSETIANL